MDGYGIPGLVGVLAALGRLSNRVVTLLWLWAVGALSLLWGLLHRAPSALGDGDQELPKPSTRKAPRQYPRRIRYVPIPGEWERELHPHWPQKAFEVPDDIPWGHIYYIRKGEYVRRGTTALVERLPTGHVSKTPVPNPYSPRSEQNARDKMEREYQVYRVLGYGNPFVPRLIDWDEESKTLTLEDHRNGDLERYMKEHAADVDPETRRKWALQAAQALESLHRRQVIHHDVTPRNFLLNDDLDLRICDFAGSSFPGHTASWGAPGERYQSRPWTRGYVPTVADDVFALGSVLFYIASGKEPYAELEDEEVEARFGKQDFPSCGELDCAAVIHGCWSGRFDDVKQVVEALS